MLEDLLHLDNLTKNFGTFTAVENVSLKLAAGEIYGFLGPNGAGKTTTIKMLAGLLQPSGGTISICGKKFATEPFYCKNLTGTSVTHCADWLWKWERLSACNQ